MNDDGVAIGAFVPHNLEQPLTGQSTGPLAGTTCAVKDAFDIVGTITGGGSPEWLADHAPATATAPTVQKLVDAGATITGKTICDEFFYSITGANSRSTVPANPRAPGRLPGGSSSGSAAATAAGICDFALGSDTGGSVRIPAAFCGLYGIRPTRGRVDLSGAMAMAPSFDTAGWFADDAGLFHNVGDVVLDAHAVSSSVDALLVAEDVFELAERPIAAALRAVLERVGEALPAPAPVTVAPTGFADWREAFRIVQGHEIWGIYGDWVTARNPALGPGVRERFAFAATITDADAKAAAEIRAAARERMVELIPPGTLLALPTAPIIAPRRDAPETELDASRAAIMALTCIAGLSGLPQVSIPFATVDHCPVGLSFIAWHGGDEALLDLCVALARWRQT